MQGAFYDDLAPWLSTHTPADARVGAFNGGLISYFSDRTTVNLDGVMNDNAIAASRAARFAIYIDAQRIDYLADNELAIAFFFDAAPTCAGWRARWETVHQVLWPRSGDPDAFAYVILKRRRMSDRPARSTSHALPAGPDPTHPRRAPAINSDDHNVAISVG